MTDTTDSIRQENARRAGRVNSATMEAPVYICDVCGMDDCDFLDYCAICGETDCVSGKIGC